jgi:hypothetical protein
MPNVLHNVVSARERANGNFDNSTCEIRASNRPDVSLIVPRNVLHKVLMYKWGVHRRASDGYMTVTTSLHTGGVRYTSNLARFLMGSPPADLHVVDHINRDTLDNSWWNLRFATYSTNAANVDTRGTIPYYGVARSGPRFATMYKGRDVAKFDYVLHAAWFYNVLVRQLQLERPENEIPEPANFNLPSGNYIERTRRQTERPRSPREPPAASCVTL